MTSKVEVGRLKRVCKRLRASRERAARDDSGITIVEAVIAGGILAAAVAGGVAAFSAAVNVRVAASERLIAVEIANEVLETAEAFGCGLPPGYNGVSAAARAEGCDYGYDDPNSKALADTDFVVKHGSFNFDVKVRMRWDVRGVDGQSARDAFADDGWDLPEDPDSNGNPTITYERLESHPLARCSKFRAQVDGVAAGVHDGHTVNPKNLRVHEPNLLRRTVTVISENTSTVTLTSFQNVIPELAAPSNYHAVAFNAEESGSFSYDRGKPRSDQQTGWTDSQADSDDKIARLVRRAASGQTYYYYWFDIEPFECLIVPFMGDNPAMYDVQYKTMNQFEGIVEEAKPTATGWETTYGSEIKCVFSGYNNPACYHRVILLRLPTL